MLTKRRKAYRKAYRKSYRKSYRKYCRNRRIHKSRRGGKDDSIAFRTIHVSVLDENDPVNGRLLFTEDIPLNATPEDVNNIIINHPSNIYGNRITEGTCRIISNNYNYYIIDNHNYPETVLERIVSNLRNER